MSLLRTTLLISSLSLLAGGCATGNSIDKNYNFNEHPNEGLLAYSTRWIFNCADKAPVVGEHSIFYYKNETVQHGINLHNPFIGSDFDNPPGNVHINTAAAGKYTIDEIKMTNGDYNYTLRPEKPVTFNVAAGKITYLGQMSVEVSSCGKKFIGDMALPDAKLAISISNEWNRDREMLKKDYQNVLNSETIIGLMKQ